METGPAPLRVVHVVLSLDLGGLERVVVALVREGARLGQRVAVVCLERPGTLAARVEELGAAVICLHKRPGLRLGIVGRLKAVFQELRPDVVHTHQIGALFYAGPAARQTRVPAVVHTEHGKHYAGRLRTRWLGRLAARHAARFVCVSQDIADEVVSCRVAPRKKVGVVFNGIDTRAFEDAESVASIRQTLGVPQGAPLIGTVGRLSEIKRQDLLLRAFARVRERVPDAHLVLVGDGPMMRSLRELAAKLGIDGNVHFAGFQARPEPYLLAMDVFALTSRSEGMPLVVLEAWAAARPVVTSNAGGLPDLIDDGRTGILFPSGDELMLSEALCGLLVDRELAARLGVAGRREVESRYDVGRMGDEYDRHYRELAPCKGRGVGCAS
jgi:glycosyltransferase involved in cell wall biosynthesis